MSDPAVSESFGREQKQQLEYVVRCGSMRVLGVMKARDHFRYGDQVVVRSQRGTEIGTVLCEATLAALGHMQEPSHGRILRSVSADDQKEWHSAPENTDWLRSTSRIASSGASS